MTNITTLNTQTNTLNNAKRAFKSLLITLAAALTLVLVATPETAQAFNMDGLTTLVEELTAETSEIVVADASVEGEETSFRDKMTQQNETMREVGQNITSKRGDVEAIASDINSETKAYVDDVETKELKGGVSLETLTNAVVSAVNGEEVTSEYELLNAGLQVAGLQSPANVVMEAVVTIVRSLLGLLLVASLIGWAKHHINKGYRN